MFHIAPKYKSELLKQFLNHNIYFIKNNKMIIYFKKYSNN